jgi:hypothetical protein
MAPFQSSSHLIWEGPPSIWQIIDNLERRKRTVLRLPTSYHPALSACLYSHMRTRGRIDLIGDAELLARITAIDGLRELTQLVEPMQKAGARLRLRSPAPHLVFNVPSNRRIQQRGLQPALQHGEAWSSRSETVLCRSCGSVHRQSAPSLQHQ